MRGDSYLDGDEPAAREERPAAAELVGPGVGLEEARQQPFEGVVRERKLERVPLDEPSLGNLRPGELEHRWTLVEPRDLAAEVLGEKAGSTGDVERPRGRERPERAGQRLRLLEPAGSPAVREHPRPEPPVVVLRSSPLVVGLHAVLDYGRAFAARVGAEFLRGAR